jgi:uncharacterized membrane protein YkoI
MNKRRTISLATALLVVLPVWALQPPASDEPDTAQPGTLLSRDEAVRRAQQRLGGGKLLGVRLRDSNSKLPYFDVKVLDGGKVKVLKINAR